MACVASSLMSRFALYWTKCVHTSGRLVIVLDVNFPVEDPTNNEASNFMVLINSYNLTQHVSSATHGRRHTLDLIITRSPEEAVTDVIVQDNALPDKCDHFHVHVYLPKHLHNPERHKGVSAKFDICPRSPARRVGSAVQRYPGRTP